MATNANQEIERRWLIDPRVLATLSLDQFPAQKLVQFYLNADKNRATRIRLDLTSQQAWLTVKGPKVNGVGAEVETPIAYNAAQDMLPFAVGRVLHKTRTALPLSGGLTIELDVFADMPVVIAEIELPSIDTHVAVPPWFGREITNDSRYANMALALAESLPDGDAAVYPTPAKNTWELYDNHPDYPKAAAALDAAYANAVAHINLLLESGMAAGKASKLGFDKAFSLFERYEKVGATDTEPRNILADRLDRAAGVLY